MRKRAFIVAGGTGGHINAAITLGNDFSKHGYQIRYLSGKRYLDYKLYKNEDCLHLPAHALMGKSPTAIVKSLVFNTYVFIRTFFLFLIQRPHFVLGCGGYICGPTLLAAKLLAIPIFILEQNSVMGVTNKILAKVANLVFTCFEHTKGFFNKEKERSLGNPIRESFFSGELRPPENKRFKILVFGGSLGAQEINNLIKAFVERKDWAYEVEVLHQTGKNKVDISPTSNMISYQQVEYIDNMFERYMSANMVICRAGASTISELRIVKRPSILIPIRFHADKHQVINAQALQKEAQFPVYLAHGDELADNDCEKLLKLIDEEYNRDKTNDIELYREKLISSSELIVKEIENYVQR